MTDGGDDGDGVEERSGVAPLLCIGVVADSVHVPAVGVVGVVHVSRVVVENLDGAPSPDVRMQDVQRLGQVPQQLDVHVALFQHAVQYASALLLLHTRDDSDVLLFHIS